MTLTLQNGLEAGRISHAYLFTGSRGTGKTTCAKILAKAVNCLNPKNGNPCGECENCVDIDAGNLDVIEIDAASNNGVENIRDIRENIHYLPAKLKYRVYIIDEVHMLSAGAFNALLKTLEEPPAHGIFILATTEVHKLPATIISRCQRFDFHRISVEDIKNRLLFVAEKEGFELKPSAAAMIGRIADGGMRDALSLLDICAGRAEIIDERAVAAAAGLADRSYLAAISESIRTGDGGRVMKQVETLYAASCDMERLCEELIAFYRDLMLVCAVPGDETVINASEDEYLRLKEQAGEYTMPAILSAMRVLEDCLNRMKRSSVRRVLLEMALLSLCSPETDTGADGLCVRVAALEQKLHGMRLTESAPKSVAVKAEKTGENARNSYPAEQKEKPPVNADDDPPPWEDADAPPADDEPKSEQPEPITLKARRPAEQKELPSAQPAEGETVLASWPEVLERLRPKNRLIYAVLQDSIAYVRDGLLLIDAKTEQFRDLVKGDFRHRDDIRDAVMAVTGKQFRLG
ncbi:MAG TPA: DNA polymerase III subunit gamma/tau, partial [Ruminococcaceae bacterium]|nr:DNA polymerase III subunit gamma/tau [Oscillospiraceae bacterium]